MEKILRHSAVLAVLLFSLHTFSDNKADVDLWGNVGFVKAMPWSADFARTNTYSFTEPDHPWINHEWLGEYLLNKVFLFGGNAGLLTLKVLLGFVLVGIFCFSFRRDRLSGPVAFLFLLLIVSTIGYGFSTRPHHFTYLWYSLFLLILRHFGRSKAAVLVALPCLALLWANLHGAFFVGILLVAVYSTVETGRFFLLKPSAYTPVYNLLPFVCLPILFAVSLVNPYGLSLWEFVFASAAIFRPYLSEWAPFNPLEHSLIHPDFIALAIISFAGLLTSRRRKDPAWTAVLALSFVAALILRRNIPLFAITAAFVIPEHLENAVGNVVKRLISMIPKTVCIVALAAFACLSSVFLVKFNKTDPLEIEVPQNRFPVDVVRFIQDNKLKGNLLVFFDWAEYCIWKLHPDCRVFLDGRFDSAYGNEVIRDFIRFIYMKKSWETVLPRYDVQMVLIHTGNPAFSGMKTLDNWALVCQNNVAGLFLRKDVYGSFLEKAQNGSAIMPVHAEASYFP